MKRLIITFVLVLLSIGVCVTTNFYVSSVASKSEEHINKAQEYVQDEKYRLALNEISSLEDYWEDNEELLAMILHHEMLEEIDQSIAVIKSSLEHSDEHYTDFWNEIAAADKKIESLKKSEALSLENIL